MNKKIVVTVFVIFIIGFVIWFYNLKPEYDEFEVLNNDEFVDIELYNQYPERKKIQSRIDSLNLKFVDSNNDSWVDKINYNGEEIFKSKYHIVPTYIDQNYLVTITGLNSFDVGGLRYFILPNYTQIVVFDINKNFQIVLNKTFKPVIGNAVIKDGDLIFVYGSEENTKYGKVEKQ